ncbi:hypothetical protein [Nocardia sp. NPDC004722]
MPASHRRARHFAWAASLVGAVGTLTALSPGLATAGIHGIEVLDCSGGGAYCPNATTVVAGQSYLLNAPYDGVSVSTPPSSFFDNGACIGNNSSKAVTWVPQTPGTHTLTTRGGRGPDSLTVTVVAAPAGATIAPQPAEGGCSIGSGSSNLFPGSSSLPFGS